MQCSNGHAVPDGTSFCSTCGVAVVSAAPVQWPSAPPASAPVPAHVPAPIPGSYPAVPATYAPPLAQPTRGMYTAAAIINWVVLGVIIVATVGFGVIVAAWFIPMTIQMHKGAKGPYKHTSLGVCTLLFCNLISGILLLVDDSGRPAKPRI